MKDNNAKWYLLPGMGANSSMYDLLRKELDFEINFIDWPKYSGEKAYSEVARRIIEENDIQDGSICGGSSLGGMVAIEIAKQRNLAAVVLLGSATIPVEVKCILTLLVLGITITPISLVQFLVGKHNDIVTKMFAAADPNFIRTMSQYLPKWSGTKDLNVPIYRIHGEQDHIISCPKTGSTVIGSAGHLLVLTHTKDCGEYLNKIHRQLTTGST